MAYRDEYTVNTTLLEGSVQFINGTSTYKLEPGQQSQLFKTGMVQVVDNVDVEEVVAWKNGKFNFQGTDIESVLRQLSRWYQVEIVYTQPIDDRFFGKIARSKNLSEVLKLLELTGRVHFEVIGNKVIVKP
jgi:ferric-dicitrate binding protein FerR (iron transport regulator)